MNNCRKKGLFCYRLKPCLYYKNEKAPSDNSAPRTLFLLVFVLGIDQGLRVCINLQIGDNSHYPPTMWSDFLHPEGLLVKSN